jgi:hypothetical protein
VSARRYLLGWALLALATAAVSAGTVVVVRQAIGGGDLVNALSQSQVRSQYDSAGGRLPNRLGNATARPTPSPVSTTRPPRHTATAGSSRPHSSSSSSGSASPSQHNSGAGSPTHGGPTPTHSPTSSASITRVLTSSGASVVVRCSSASSSATVYLVSWSPAQGYRVDDVRRGPAQEASIDLEGHEGSVSVTYDCSSTGPVQHVEQDDGSDS